MNRRALIEVLGIIALFPTLARAESWPKKSYEFDQHGHLWLRERHAHGSNWYRLDHEAHRHLIPKGETIVAESWGKKTTQALFGDMKSNCHEALVAHKEVGLTK
jgi:hypothetical protein